MKKQSISLTVLVLTLLTSFSLFAGEPPLNNQLSISTGENTSNSTWIEGFYLKTIELGDTEVIICREMKNWICFIILEFPTETDIVVDPDGENIHYNNVSNYNYETDINGNTTLTITP